MPASPPLCAQCRTVPSAQQKLSRCPWSTTQPRVTWKGPHEGLELPCGLCWHDTLHPPPSRPVLSLGRPWGVGTEAFKKAQMVPGEMCPLGIPQTRHQPGTAKPMGSLPQDQCQLLCLRCGLMLGAREEASHPGPVVSGESWKMSLASCTLESGRRGKRPQQALVPAW